MPYLKYDPPSGGVFPARLPTHDAEIRVQMSRGMFYARHRGQDLVGATIEQVVRRADEIETAALAKAERAKLRRQAEVTPLPAMRLNADCGLTLVHVRGADQRTGNALITLADGSKGKTPSTSLLRPLTEEETAEHAALHDRYIAAVIADNAFPMTAIHDVLETHARTAAPVVVGYNRETGEFVAEIDGLTFAAPQYPDVQRAVESHVFVTAVPWRIEEQSGKRHHVVVANTATRYRAGYPTREMAEGAAQAATERNAAQKKLQAWVRDPSRQFDLSWAQ